MNKAKVVQKAEAGEGLTVAEIKVYQKAVKPEKQVYGKYYGPYHACDYYV